MKIRNKVNIAQLKINRESKMDMKIFLFGLFITMINFDCVIGDETRVTVNEGEHVVLNCSFTTDFKKVIWKRADYVMPIAIDETVFPGDYRITAERGEKSWSLKIDNVVMSDGGEYVCMASADDLKENKSFFLDVQSVPVTKEPENTVSNIRQYDGKTTILSCSVEDKSLYRVIWMKDGTDNVISVDHHVFTRDERISLDVSIPYWDLIIKDVNPSDSGKFICLATNNNRSVTKVFNLKVILDLDTTSTSSTATTVTQDDSNSESVNEAPSSKGISNELLKASQLQFYQEEIRTDRKRRKLIDIQIDFFKVAKRYFESREEKGNTK